MMRRSDSGAEKMMGTSIDSPKLDPLAPGATAILQQNWRGGREVENRRGEVGKTRETYFSLFLRSTFTFPIKTILKSSVPPLLLTSLAGLVLLGPERKTTKKI